MACRFIKLFGVPVAIDKYRCGKEVGVFDVVVHGDHAAHRLSGGVETVGVDVAVGDDAPEETDHYVNLVGVLIGVVDSYA